MRISSRRSHDDYCIDWITEGFQDRQWGIQNTKFLGFIDTKPSSTSQAVILPDYFDHLWTVHFTWELEGNRFR